MFPLFTNRFPSSASDLERLLNRSLQRLFITKEEPAMVRDKAYPDLEEISISLDGAQLPDNPQRPAAIPRNASPALRVDQLTVNARPFVIGQANLHLSLLARNVRFVQGADADQQLALALENAADGTLEVSITKADLGDLVAQVAQQQAGKQGITVEAATIELRPNNQHSVTAQIQLRIRKLFVSASLNLAGQLDLNDRLNLRLSGLNCTGTGAMATIACSILNPYLHKIESKEFPLMVLPIGEIHLRDVRLTVNEKVKVTAEFGAAVPSGGQF